MVEKSFLVDLTREKSYYNFSNNMPDSDIPYLGPVSDCPEFGSARTVEEHR